MPLRRKGSVVRDDKGRARQTLITRGPGSLRHKQRAPATKSLWTNDARHLVGSADSVMLENYQSLDAFLDNLTTRFNNELIYTYIRNVVVSINPYADLGIYTPGLVEEYHGRNMFELPPHLYALANQAYYTMREETSDQCILISGESGAGKTEASKQILQFLVANSTNTGLASKIRDRLLQSNPILEAFGNAKTMRNDNSSRFGKYMEIQFDFKGEPLGGKVINYLLEKSRVVSQLPGERNFHIFYMLLAGSPEYARKFGLEQSPDRYHYTSQGGNSAVKELDDATEFETMVAAMADLGFAKGEIDALLGVIATIMHLGEVKFAAVGDASKVSGSQEAIAHICKITGVKAAALEKALTNQTRQARGEKIVSALTKEQADYARDALAKSTYNRAFNWLVSRINKALEMEVSAPRTTVMGLLDIYGFEILQINGFEQFCINYCNEKLQQLFVELTLRSEQEEYEREGIKWESVEYFNNIVICDLIEGKAGMIAVLNDTCLGPGNSTDADMLRQFDSKFARHKHYSSWQANKKLKRDQFVVCHYAGDVSYNVDGFLDKNNDLLFRDLIATMLESSNTVIQAGFNASELDSKKRPPTAGHQFRESMNALMAILMAKSPSYVRCIKPNEKKAPMTWEKDLVVHQIKYLGLMENLRVCRAGYCYRRPFAFFLERYKSLCPATWPHWTGSESEAARTLTSSLRLPAGEVAIGETKVFIRNPKTVQAIETGFQRRKPSLATKIQAKFRAYSQKKKFQELRAAVIVAQKFARVVLARVRARKTRKAIQTIRVFIKGFMLRNQPACKDNELFLKYVRASWLMEVRRNLPRNLLDKRWVKRTPPSLAKASKILHQLCRRNLALKYRRSLTPHRKAMLNMKWQASMLFRGNKASYPASVAVPFTGTHIEEADQPAVAAAFKKSCTESDRKMLYSTIVHKIDRHNYGHSRDDVVIVTNDAIHVYGYPKIKLKYRLPLTDVTSMSLSKLYDGLVVLHTPGEAKGDKGDFIMESPHVIEFALNVFLALRRSGKMPKTFRVHCAETVTHVLRGGKTGTITFQVGPEPQLGKATVDSQKCLRVVAPEVHGPEDFRRGVRTSMKRRADPRAAAHDTSLTAVME